MSNSYASSWISSQQERENAMIQQQRVKQVALKQRVASLKKDMSSLIVSVNFMRLSMKSFNRNLKNLMQQQQSVALSVENQINSSTSLEYNATNSKYNRDHTMSSNDSKKHLTIDFKTSNIDFFVSNLIVTSEYSANDVINVNKYIIYRVVILFVQQIRRIARTSSEDIASRLHKCLRDFAMQWYFDLMMKLQDRISHTMKIFCTRLKQKYKMFTSQTFDKLIAKHYSMIDAQQLRSMNEYIQIILRYSRTIELSEFATLTIA